MTEISPAAQAVYEATWAAYWLKDAEHPADAELIAAAALRAAAGQAVPLRLPPKIDVDAKRPTLEWYIWDAKQQALFDILAIAAELEAQ